MKIQEMLDSKRAKTEEFEAIVALAKTEERELTKDEESKVDGLKTEVRSLESQISELEKQESERKAQEEADKVEAERKAKEDAEKAETERKAQEDADKVEAERKAQEEADKVEAARKAKEEMYATVRSEVEVAFRAMSVVEAEYELDLAYLALEKAWDNWYEAVEAAEEEAIKGEIKKLIAEVLAETSVRAEAKTKAQEEAQEREAKIKELEETITQEREAKEALELEKQNTEDLSQGERKETMKNQLFEQIREAVKTPNTKQVIKLERSEGGDVLINGERAAIDGDTSVMDWVIPVGVSNLSIIGYEPIYKDMGCEIFEGVKGTYNLPYEDPIHAEQLAELASATGDTVTPDGVLVSPKRYQKWKDFTVETLYSAADGFYEKVVADLIKGVDRAIDADVYRKASGGATIVTGANDITKDSFDALMGEAEVEYMGAFLAPRKTFFEAKGVVIDAGSGRFLVETVAGDRMGKGTCYDGTPFWYSNNFVDDTNEKFVVYGDTGMIHVADYSKTEIIIDNITQISEGKIRINVIKMADVALKNPNAFSKTEDLDPAV